MVPFLSGWGHWVVGIGGGGVSRAPKPKNRVDVQYFFLWRLLGGVQKTRPPPDLKNSDPHLIKL